MSKTSSDINNIGFSVVLCCYNSESRLTETLNHLQNQQTHNEFSWELIIVDNNSTDNTAIFAENVWSSYNTTIPIKIVKEINSGLTYARKKGISVARYNLILFCDDDNWLDKSYLYNAFEIMQKRSDIGCLGGLNEVATDGCIPDWFKILGNAYACGPQGEIEGYINQRLYIYGAGMILRKSIIDFMETLRFESLLSDRKGVNLSSGGDSEISIVALMMGYNLYYSPRLRLKHFMPANRLNWSYLVRMFKGHAESGYILELYHDIYKGNPIKRSKAHEGIIRLYYFLKETPIKDIKGWLRVNKNEGCDEFITSFVIVEKLIAHFKNRSYRKQLDAIKSLYDKLKEVSFK